MNDGMFESGTFDFSCIYFVAILAIFVLALLEKPLIAGMIPTYE